MASVHARTNPGVSGVFASKALPLALTEWSGVRKQGRETREAAGHFWHRIIARAHTAWLSVAADLPPTLECLPLAFLRRAG